MKAIVHIGTPKTGTTTAQSWFAANRDFLAQHGVLYPSSLGSTHHTRLSTLCRSAERPERGFTIFGIRSPEEHKVFSDGVLSDFAAELRQGPQISSCIISSEWLYNRLTERREREKLKQFLEDFFDDFEILVWLRPQVEYVLSFASTICRSGDVLNRKRLKRLISSDSIRYNERLLEWEDVFDRGRIHVIPYKRDPNVVQNILHRVGIETRPQIDTDRKNTQLGLRVMSMANHIRLEHANRERDPGWDRRDYFAQIVSEEPLRIDLDYARKIHATFVPGNAKLVSRHKGLLETDLTPAWERFEGKGNIEQLDVECGFQSELTQLVELMNADLKIQRARTEIARAEVVALRGEAPDLWLARAREWIEAADRGRTMPGSVEAAMQELARVTKLVRSG